MAAWLELSDRRTPEPVAAALPAPRSDEPFAGLDDRVDALPAEDFEDAEPEVLVVLVAKATIWFTTSDREFRAADTWSWAPVRASRAAMQS